MRHSLSLFALFTSSAFAAIDGTNVNWADYTDMVNNQCTGTLVGGKYILTAAHCENFKETVRTKNNVLISPVEFKVPIGYETGDPLIPTYNENLDIAILTLPTRLESIHIRFFADLNTDPLVNDEEVRLFGFAATYDQLSYSKMTINTAPTGGGTDLYTAEKTINGGDTQGGDSGGAWLNNNDEIVSVHNAGSTDGALTNYTYGSNLHDSKDFILSSIDRWHYPTLATANGAKTLTVQSLHVGGVADSAYPEGGVSITGGTCVSNTIGPFEKCTYIIEATGEGKLWLTPDEYIHVNKPTASAGGSAGSSGGSLSILSMLALFGLGFIRNRRKVAVTH